MGDVSPKSHEIPGIFEVNFIRPGSLGVAKRPFGEEPNWANDHTTIIYVSLGLSKRPLPLVVRAFIPKPGEDVTSRFWIGPDGVSKHYTSLAPYAIANIPEARKTVEAYILNNCLCFDEVVVHSVPNVRIVYEQVVPHLIWLRRYAARPDADKVYRDLRDLMESYCPLWWGVRNMMGSAWLVGSETLGMKPCYETGYPLYGRVSVPREVVQTAGCLISQVTRPLQREFLNNFRKVAVFEGHSLEYNRRAFYTLFLIVYMMLHECEDINKDRERHARQNFLKEKFSLPAYVEALHKSAYEICGIWKAFCRRVGADFSAKDSLERSLCFLPEDQADLISATFTACGREVRLYPMECKPETWCQDLCFIAHMFDMPWLEDALYKGR